MQHRPELHHWFEYSDPSGEITFEVDLREVLRARANGHFVRIHESRHAKKNMKAYESALMGMHLMLDKAVYKYELMQKGLADEGKRTGERSVEGTTDAGIASDTDQHPSD